VRFIVPSLAQDRYAKNAEAVVSLKFYIVWCPKYRRPVLTGLVEVRLKELPTEVADEHAITIHVMEVMPDHV
jgi:putative transposase